MDAQAILSALWFILPAYTANSMAINASGLPALRRWSTPVDFGRSWRGRRVFGDGKTWRGLVCGTLSGGLTGWLQAAYGPGLAVWLPPSSPLLGFLLGFGALVGDMTASFLKRRTGKERGAHVPGLDQLDYILGAFVFSMLLVPFNFMYFLIVVVATIPAHVIANLVAYKLKLKTVPW